MAPSKIRKAIGAVKDRTSIGLAKVGSTASLSDLDVAIVKATRHEEYPPDERYVREILSLTSYSHAYVGACVSTISRRLNKTKNWVVALKTLMLIQRLLSEGDVTYEQEIFFSTRRGTRLLNMSDFRDVSGSSNAWDYSAFVRTYALYLDEKLEFRMQGRRGKRSGYSYSKEEEEEDGGSNGRGGGGGGGTSSAVVGEGTPIREMKIEKLFSRVHHLMQLLERFLACKPTGAAKNNRVVTVAFYPLVKDSFQLYYDIMEVMAAFLERFQQLDVPNSVKVYDFFTRLSKQYEELDAMYNWCRSAGIARSSEYPEVEKIPKNRLDVLDDIIQRKSSNNIPTPNPDHPVSVIEKEPEDQAAPSEDMNAIKALPPPQGFADESDSKDEPEAAVDSPKEERDMAQQEGDLLSLSEINEQTTEEHSNRLALALFDADLAKPSAPETTATPWEAFKEDWETALVQTASHLSNQKISLAGGFDTLLLDGMYQHGMTAQAAASSGYMATGSSSSVAFGSAGKPAMLTLPAPPEANGGAAATSSDPFAASLSVAPPAYVQMSEMEKKQRLLVEEQVMWQNYARDGMQGLVGLGKIQQQNQYPHNARMY
ncbi:hypothetical protein F511_13287 [Dorcoceras hygrometricum]|uniref:ENTH domain-containing protein n=1 Tax=Dorcoceras hygrometricum TaxID=472368 RepID=A0A2Z7BU01_9LAMI|nr:hypothetical protein F511_13287 [Dorcoceras hygrometricum]